MLILRKTKYLVQILFVIHLYCRQLGYKSQSLVHNTLGMLCIIYNNSDWRLRYLSRVDSAKRTILIALRIFSNYDDYNVFKNRLWTMFGTRSMGYIIIFYAIVIHDKCTHIFFLYRLKDAVYRQHYLHGILPYCRFIQPRAML